MYQSIESSFQKPIEDALQSIDNNKLRIENLEHLIGTAKYDKRQEIKKIEDERQIIRQKIADQLHTIYQTNIESYLTPEEQRDLRIIRFLPTSRKIELEKIIKVSKDTCLNIEDYKGDPDNLYRFDIGDLPRPVCVDVTEARGDKNIPLIDVRFYIDNQPIYYPLTRDDAEIVIGLHPRLTFNPLLLREIEEINKIIIEYQKELDQEYSNLETLERRVNLLTRGIPLNQHHMYKNGNDYLREEEYYE